MAKDMTTTVIKVGGANLEREAYVQEFCDYVGRRFRSGERIVLVHGGGAAIGKLHDVMGVAHQTVDGLRVTSPEGMDITVMVLCGLVNKRLVAELVRRGVPALGFSGIDLGLLRAPLIDGARLGRVGGRPETAAISLEALLELGVAPVVAPVALGPDESAVNVNADMAADAIASAIHADRLEFVSDVPGVRTDASDGGFASRLHVSEARALLERPDVVSGGMIPKLRSAIAASEAGVRQIRVGTLQGMQAGTATELTA